MDFFIPVILGTAREGRRTEAVARFVYADLKKRPAIESEFLDVRDFRLSATDDREDTPLVKKYRGIIARADGIIITSPEYNHGYPGELKMMLDMAYEEYARKPVAIVGTGGGMGGVRAVEQLRMVAIELRAVPILDAVYFSNVSKLFEESGVMRDQAVYEGRVAKMLDELIWYAAALKRAREEKTP